MNMPIPLTQELFEALWSGNSPHSNETNRWLILFSSQRCEPCARIDKASIEEVIATTGATFFVCDATVNRYTPVYCDITRYPTFQLMEPGKIIASLTSSDTATVIAWIQEHSTGR